MHVSEGNLTGQFYCDYLTILAKELLTETISETRRREIHENMVFRNLFLHRMSVDGGFHARVLTTLLASDTDRTLLFELIKSGTSQKEVLPMIDWLKKEYQVSLAENNLPRKLSISSLLRSHLSGTNAVAEILSAENDSHPESWWQLLTRKITFTEVKNPELYFSQGHRPFWQEYPLNRYAAYLAGVSKADTSEVYDCVICIAGVWFSSLDREEMITWLNMPQVLVDEWYRITSPLLKLDEEPEPALATANWLYASGNYDAAADLYAGITLAYPKSDAAIFSFERIGAILRKTGDFDNAFEAYKNAFIFSRGKSSLTTALGLKNLCDVGEELGEDMTGFYARISNIAEEMSPDERSKLYLELAASSRKRKSYADEYAYLEKILAEETTVDTFLQTALTRLTELNNFIQPNGCFDTHSLSLEDERVENAAFLARGDAAYFGFDPAAAKFWYRLVTDQEKVSSRIFQASVTGEFFEDAKLFAKTFVDETVLSIMEGYPVAFAAEKLGKAIDETLADGRDTAVVLRPVFILLSEDEILPLSEIITNRSTRDDERSIVCQAVSRVCLELGLAETARQFLRLALRANPGREMRSRIFADLGFVEFELGDYKAAVEANQAALKINEEFPAGYAGLAKAYTALGEYDAAAFAAEKAALQNPANESYRHLKSALTEVLAKPILEKPDKQFILQGPGTLQAAAAWYSELGGAFDPNSWDAASNEDGMRYRNLL